MDLAYCRCKTCQQRRLPTPYREGVQHCAICYRLLPIPPPPPGMVLDETVCSVACLDILLVRGA